MVLGDNERHQAVEIHEEIKANAEWNPNSRWISQWYILRPNLADDVEYHLKVAALWVQFNDNENRNIYDLHGQVSVQD